MFPGWAAIGLRANHLIEGFNRRSFEEDDYNDTNQHEDGELDGAVNSIVRCAA